MSEFAVKADKGDVTQHAFYLIYQLSATSNIKVLRIETLHRKTVFTIIFYAESDSVNNSYQWKIPFGHFVTAIVVSRSASRLDFVILLRPYRKHTT